MDRPKTIVLALVGLMLTGCSNVKVSSNISEFGEAVVQSSVVDIYRQSEIFERNYVPLGQVDVSYCGDDRDIVKGEPAPSDASMQNALKLQTRKLGGNALVIKECGPKVYARCQVYKECIGLAYEVKDS